MKFCWANTSIGIALNPYRESSFRGINYLCVCRTSKRYSSVGETETMTKQVLHFVQNSLTMIMQKSLCNWQIDQMQIIHKETNYFTLAKYSFLFWSICAA